MQLSSIFSACARNGVAVTKPLDSRNDYYVLRKGDKVLDFYAGSDGYVSNIVYRSPHTDIMTDCFCDSYFDTIKRAMQYLNPTGEKVVVREVSAVKSTETPVVDGVMVTRNAEKDGIEIRFPSKPDSSVINSLKDKGFRWSPFNSVWWKRFNDADYAWAMETFMVPVEA